MQEEITTKILAYGFRASTVTAHTLWSLLKHVLSKKNEQVKYGKQTLKSLGQRGQKKLEAVEITSNDIKRFQREAKKCGLSFSLMKDPEKPNIYVVFFRADEKVNLDYALKRLLKRKSKGKQRRPLAERLKAATSMASQKNMEKEVVTAKKIIERGR